VIWQSKYGEEGENVNLVRVDQTTGSEDGGMKEEEFTEMFFWKSKKKFTSVSGEHMFYTERDKKRQCSYKSRDYS
jgi:NADH pyrophosphatase NudC (nudix superfamily)